MVEKHVRSLKSRKASSFDNIHNEHLKLGGHSLYISLAKLFNRIIETGLIPKLCKKGLIIPVYKDNGKSRTDAQNYRPITLLPVIYKLFEHILHEKLDAWVISENIKFPSVQQNAYQRHLVALTASFCLQEAIFNNIEQTSKVCWTLRKHLTLYGYKACFINYLN